MSCSRRSQAANADDDLASNYDRIWLPKQPRTCHVNMVVTGQWLLVNAGTVGHCDETMVAGPHFDRGEMVEARVLFFGRALKSHRQPKFSEPCGVFHNHTLVLGMETPTVIIRIATKLVRVTVLLFLHCTEL